MGKVTVCAPRYEKLGLMKLKIFNSSGVELLCLKHGETGEIDIKSDTYIYGKISINPAGKEIKVFADKDMKLGVNLGGLGQANLEIIGTSASHGGIDSNEKAVYDLVGSRGRYIKVYEDKCIIGTKAGLMSFVTGNGTDGEKTIYYSDVLGVQFKRCGMTLGYLQLETGSSTMNNRKDNFFNENSFTFDQNLDFKMEEVSAYIKNKVDQVKKAKSSPIISQTVAVSPAEEIKKFKELLDLGVITQEEFDAKKKQLLGL